MHRQPVVGSAQRRMSGKSAVLRLSLIHILNVREVDENALRGLRAEIAGRGRVLGDADGGLEHQVKLADGREVMLAADGAYNIFVLGNELVHLVEAHRVDVDLMMLCLLYTSRQCEAPDANGGGQIPARKRKAADPGGGRDDQRGGRDEPRIDRRCAHDEAADDGNRRACLLYTSQVIVNIKKSEK